MIPLPDKIQGNAKDIRWFHKPYATSTAPANLEDVKRVLGAELVKEAQEDGYIVLSNPDVAVMDKHTVQVFCQVWRQP